MVPNLFGHSPRSALRSAQAFADYDRRKEEFWALLTLALGSQSLWKMRMAGGGPVVATATIAVQARNALL